MPLFVATAHTAQNLFLTPIKRSFLVWLPKITATPLLALYECLWLRFDQPPSTTTVILGIPCWKLFVSIACLFSSSATSCMDCARHVRISFPRNSSVSVYIRFCMPGKSTSGSVEFNRVNPPPVDIPPRTARRLTIHFFHCWFAHKAMFWWKRFGHIFHMMLVKLRPGLSACFLFQWCITHHILRCVQSADGISKLVHVHNSAAAERIGSKLCCLCCSESLIFLV